MKKILTLFAAVGLIVLSGCSSNDNDVDNDTIPQAFEIRKVNLAQFANNTTDHYVYANTFGSFVGGDLFNDETILIYRKTDETVSTGATVWQLIPRSIDFGNGKVADYFFDFSTEDFVISVTANYNLATQQPGLSLINNQTFRVVIVPSVLARTINKDSYLDVMAALKLNESQVKKINF